MTKGTLVYRDGIHKHSLHQLSLTGLRDRTAATIPTLHDILECFLVTHIQQSLNIVQRLIKCTAMQLDTLVQNNSNQWLLGLELLQFLRHKRDKRMSYSLPGHKAQHRHTLPVPGYQTNRWGEHRQSCDGGRVHSEGVGRGTRIWVAWRQTCLVPQPPALSQPPTFWRPVVWDAPLETWWPHSPHFPWVGPLVPPLLNPRSQECPLPLVSQGCHYSCVGYELPVYIVGNNDV